MSHSLESQRSMFRSPTLCVGLWVKSAVSADPGCRVDIDFAHEIGQLAVAGNHAVLARLHFSLVSAGLDFSEMHGTATTGFQRLNVQAVEQLRPRSSSSQSDGIAETEVFDDKTIITPGELMNALSVRPPWIMVVALFGIETRGIQQDEGQRPEKNIDVCEIFWVVSRLLMIAVMACKRFGEGKKGVLIDLTRHRFGI